MNSLKKNYMKKTFKIIYESFEGDLCHSIVIANNYAQAERFTRHFEGAKKILSNTKISDQVITDCESLELSKQIDEDLRYAVQECDATFEHKLTAAHN